MRLNVSVGDKKNKLTILKVGRKCLCLCDCGNEKLIYKSDFYHEKIKSCGCATAEYAQQTFLKKYGVKSPMQNKEILKKAQDTNQQKYGSVCSLHGTDQRAAKERTWEKKYGGNPAKDKKTKKKAKKTMLERYGVEHALQSEEFKAKAKETMVNRFGDSPLKHPDILEKKKQSSLMKYGVENPMQNPEVKNKSYQTKIANGSHRESLGERELRDWVIDSGFSDAAKKIINSIEYDIAIESLKILIEYNGLYWHSEATGRQSNYHLDKTKNGEAHGYSVIHVWEHEWLNKKDAVKSVLLSKFNKNKTLGARKCHFAAISHSDARDFCQSRHLQGAPVNTILALGCFADDRLIGVCTIGPNPRNNSEYNLTRLCFEPGINVIGALSKFSKMANSILKSKIYTFVKLDKSDSSGYEKSGWKVEKILKPDYFYTDKNGKRYISKISRKKGNVKTPEGMTEKEHAAAEGLIRVWDCGKIKLAYG